MIQLDINKEKEILKEFSSVNDTFKNTMMIKFKSNLNELYINEWDLDKNINFNMFMIISVYDSKCVDLNNVIRLYANKENNNYSKNDILLIKNYIDNFKDDITIIGYITLLDYLKEK